MKHLQSRIACSGAFHRKSAGPAAMLVGLLVVACTPPYIPPQQVQSSNPTVTYKYHTDQDLLDVNRSAATFCNQYQSMAQASSFTSDPDGSKVVAYQCVPALASTSPAPSHAPNLTYNYRSDRELLAASQSAQSYCTNEGGQRAVSSITTNADGTRTAAFQCSP